MRDDNRRTTLDVLLKHAGIPVITLDYANQTFQKKYIEKHPEGYDRIKKLDTLDRYLRLYK